MLEKELATTSTASYLVDKGDVACSTDCRTSVAKMAKTITVEALILKELYYSLGSQVWDLVGLT